MKKVKSIRYGNALVCSCLAILLLFSVAHASDYEIHSLMAGQNINVGDVSVWNDADHLYVKYETTDGWYLIESHVHFATSLDDIPQTEGNPIPGKFDYKMEHDLEVSKYTYEMDLNGLEPGTVYIATHADVLLLNQKGKIIQEETAWGDGEDFPGDNWATYFTYETDNVPPSISITNPVNNSVTTTTTPYITIEFTDDDSGIDLSSFSVQINGVVCTDSFDVTDTRATYQATSLPSGSNVISASISDNAGNTSTVVSDFTIGSSTEPIRYIFSVANNDWIFASPGDETCTQYLSREDLGVLSFSDVVALSKVSPDGNLFFTLSGQGGILQSPCDGSNSVVLYNNTQLDLESGDQVVSGHIGLLGTGYFSIEGQPNILQSSGNDTNSSFMENYLLGLEYTDLINCLHIGYDNTIYFCGPDGQIVSQSTGGSTNTQFLTATELGVPGSSIDAFAILPDTVPPEITITNPIDGAFLYTTTPNITVTFQDSGSGINTATFYAEINGTDMTSAFSVSDTGATYQVPDSSPLAVGDNALFVTIEDRVGNEADATSNFTVGILRAIPGASPTSGTAPLTVHFTTDGEDPAGTIQRFQWDFDGNGSYDTYDEMARDYNHTYNSSGTYNATLYVWSSTGESASASITITVENNPPVAIADVVPSNGEIPLDVTFYGSGSDPDGSIVLYEWDFEGDGDYEWSSITTGNITHTYTTTGTYQAVFRVTDDNGLTDTATATTTVVRAGPPGSPTATASANTTSGNAPLTVNFNGTATDPNDDVVLYEWDFDNDGTYDWSSATSGSTSHTYNTAGTHVASFRVKDSTGLTGIDQLLITVNIQTSLSIQRDTVGFPSGTGMTASASSSTNPPSYGIDGNTSTFWYTSSGAVSNAWYEVRFNTPQMLSGLIVTWYYNSPYYYSMTRGRIDVYDSTDTLVYSQEDDYSGEVSQVSLPNIENATRLRLTAITTYRTDYVVIREFEVDSTPMPGTEVEPTGTNINTSISAGAPVSILIKDSDGNTVRTLVNNQYRDMGTYADYWDCKDDNGIVVNDGVHYAIFQYIVDGHVQTYDLTDSTGGSRYTNFRANTGGSQSSPATFSPFEDDFLPIRFTLSNAAEVTLFVGYLWGQDTRIRTLTNRVPFPAGTHTVYWDGLDDNEQLATAPPGWYLIPGAWAYTLPDNAMYMTGGGPQITDIAAEPNYFSPFSEKCDENGMDEGIILTYNVSENVAQVEFRVYSLETGALLRTDVQNNIPSGENTYFWDAKNNNGEYVDIGNYQIGIIATDGDGNESMLRYSLIRVEY
jgi:PKD repeat protein